MLGMRDHGVSGIQKPTEYRNGVVGIALKADGIADTASFGPAD
jgi:hypothetical protein